MTSERKVLGRTVAMSVATLMAALGCVNRTVDRRQFTHLPMAEARRVDTGPEDYRFECRTEAGTLTLAKDGNGTWANPGGASSSVAVGGGGDLQIVWCGSLGSDLVVVWDAMGFVDGWSGVTLHRSTGEPGWSLELPSYGVGQPLVAGSAIYVTLSGLVSKIDLRSGKALWTIGGLERPGRFVSFKLPRLSGGRVEFPDSAPGHGALVVDDATGEVISGAPEGYSPLKPRPGHGTR